MDLLYSLPNGGRGGGLGIGAQVVPIVINSVMYMPAGNLVVAAEADAGKEMWRYQLAAGQASTHGVAYWPGDKQNSARILFTLDAITGKYKWTVQTVHHALWDFDNPPAPVLLDITDDNRFRALKITAAARANPVSY